MLLPSLMTPKQLVLLQSSRFHVKACKMIPWEGREEGNRNWGGKRTGRQRNQPKVNRYRVSSRPGAGLHRNAALTAQTWWRLRSPAGENPSALRTFHNISLTHPRISSPCVVTPDDTFNSPLLPSLHLPQERRESPSLSPCRGDDTFNSSPLSPLHLPQEQHEPPSPSPCCPLLKILVPGTCRWSNLLNRRSRGLCDGKSYTP